MEQDSLPKGKNYVIAQITLLLLTISFLLFLSILFGIAGTLSEINVAIPIIVVAISLLSMGMGLRKLPLNKVTSSVLISLVITELILIGLIMTSSDSFVKAVTPYVISTTLYMTLGILACVALSFAFWGKVPFITWENTKIWRDIFFIGCAVWFVFGLTSYFSIRDNTPFETTPFLGVPFSASQVDWHSGILEGAVKGAAGYIEGNFFLTFLLGFISAVGITKLFPDKRNVLGRFMAIAAVAAVYALIIAYLHTGMHDISQTDVLFFIGLFFFAGAMTTLFFETSFSFTIAQGLIDFMKGLFATLDAQMIQLAWLTFFIITAISLVALYFWLREIKVIKK